MTETTTAPDALDGLIGEQVRVYFPGGGAASGVLAMADSIGVMLEPCEHGLARRYPETDIDPEGFIPWSQIKLITPAPEETAA